jgi:peptidoglycan/LPS O-acetylase OafA/YrhL
VNKIWIGVLLGSALGALDGLSALLSAGDDPAIREGILGIVVGSTAKGLVAGLILGFFARRVSSVRAGVILGIVVGALLAAAICVMQLAADQPPYWLEIMLPGTVVGLIVGFATQKYGRGRSPVPAAA